MAPIIEDAPANCKEISRQSKELLSNEDRGGYNVHPTPTPSDTVADKNK